MKFKRFSQSFQVTFDLNNFLGQQFASWPAKYILPMIRELLGLVTIIFNCSSQLLANLCTKGFSPHTCKQALAKELSKIVHNYKLGYTFKTSFPFSSGNLQPKYALIILFNFLTCFSYLSMNIYEMINKVAFFP